MFIGKEVKSSQTSVNVVLREYSNNNYFRNKYFQSIRNPITSARDKRKLKEIVKKHHFRNMR